MISKKQSAGYLKPKKNVYSPVWKLKTHKWLHSNLLALKRKFLAIATCSNFLCSSEASLHHVKRINWIEDGWYQRDKSEEDNHGGYVTLHSIKTLRTRGRTPRSQAPFIISRWWFSWNDHRYVEPARSHIIVKGTRSWREKEKRERIEREIIGFHSGWGWEREQVPGNNRQRRKEIRATNRNGRRQAGRTRLRR